MRKVKLEAIEEGQVLAADVKNVDDMLLLPAGCQLTARHIRILQTWGVPVVTVETPDGAVEDVDPLARLPPETAQRLTQEVRAAFWQLDETNPAQKELLRLALKRRARQVTEKMA